MRSLHSPNSWAIGSLVLFVGTLASRGLGFVRELAMAALFGTSAATDAWLMASVVPNLLFSTVNAALANVVVPVLAHRREEPPRDDVLYVREMVALVGGVTVGLTILAEALAPILVRLLAPGFADGQLQRTILLTRIMLPTIIFWAGAGLAMGVLQARAIYAPTSGAPVLVNLVRIATILIFGRLWGITGVAVGFVLAVAGQWLYLLPTLTAQGFSLRPKWQIRDPRTRQTLRLTGPFLLTSGTGALGVLVDRILASSLPTGNIAALNYAFLLTQLPLGLLVNAVSLPGFTRLAEEWNAAQRDLFGRVLQKTLELAQVIAVPSAVFLLFGAVPLVHLLYQRDAFTTHSTQLTAHVLTYWALGLPAFAASIVLGRSLFALRAVRPMIAISTVTVACNIAGDLLLIHPLGAAGLAFATSIASWMAAGMTLYYLFRRRLLPDRFLSPTLVLRYAVAALLTVWAARLAVVPLGALLASGFGGRVLGLAALAGVGGAVWIGSLSGGHWIVSRRQAGRG